MTARLGIVIVVALAVFGVFARPAALFAIDPPPQIVLVIENNQFQPAEVKVKAGVPFVLVITNNNPKSAEFESKELRVEKVVPAGKTIEVKIRALKAGSYPFFDDFHRQTTGRVVAE